ncbi:MAG: AlpA family phage regulatory protein [Acetobacter syzygii]|uniref:helix-turn-helix transcriptional regulator n=1 Tax=Acetobacter syzygii TaxID=146476 RepID=UPI0039EB64D4
MTSTPTDQMLTRKEVQDMVRISCTTLYRWIEEGIFPSPVKYTSRCVRWRQSDVQNWINQSAQVAA